MKAHDAGDVKVLDQIEDGDFTLADDFGELTKEQHLDSDRHREKAQGVTRKIDNERVRFYGDAALLTEIDHASDAAGKADFLTTGRLGSLTFFVFLILFAIRDYADDAISKVARSFLGFVIEVLVYIDFLVKIARS